MQFRIAAPLVFLVALPVTALVAATATETPLYQRMLDLLRSSNSVVPPTIAGAHPYRTVYNEEAIIPPQCYTRTEGQFNPCYVCHQNSKTGRENVMNDGGLQLAYSFSDLGMSNHWSNLFEDRSEAVDRIRDNEILEWVASDNYTALAPRLEKAGFAGWIPDLKNLHLGKEAFDDEGVARDGSHWVAFNYKPLPSTFWPTNGSTDDVMIRLPPAFRTTKTGEYSRDVYRANLAITEALIKQLESITTQAIDERIAGRDLDGDGELGVAYVIRKPQSFIGAAEQEFADTTFYPEGTEFLHTVRYLGIDANGSIGPSTRMKEVRYMRKVRAYRKSVYGRHYQLEGFAKELGQLPQYQYLGDRGLDNGAGWQIHGFIENHAGELRALTYEENLFCMGCHTSLGATIDKTFSFPRKVDGAAGWGYVDLKGMPDAPNMGETRGEIVTYLERVGGGGEFRSNEEMFERWFHPDGRPDVQALASAADVYELVTPSVERALQLNKAYRAIVASQAFIYGRDATVSPPANVYEFVDNRTAPVLPADLFFEWDIRLDWDSTIDLKPDQSSTQHASMQEVEP